MSVLLKTPAASCHSHDSVDDAEKGMYDSTRDLTALSPPSSFTYLHQEKTERDPRPYPLSQVHEGITPNPSVPELSLSFPPIAKVATGRRNSVNANDLETTVKKPAPMKPKISRWILFNLWFNTYRKFFTFITLLNLAGIIMLALDRFPYAKNHQGALVLGNLLAAILMRNELWFRFMYWIAIHGLRSVRGRSSSKRYLLTDINQWAPLCVKFAVTSSLQHAGGIHSGCALSGSA